MIVGLLACVRPETLIAGSRDTFELLDSSFVYVYHAYRRVIVFEWDDKKELRNREKHRVSFLDASTTFHDPLGIEVLDAAHSDREERWVRIGASSDGELLVTVLSSERNEFGLSRVVPRVGGRGHLMKKEYDFSKGRRVSRELPAVEDLPKSSKVRITIMLDADVLGHFKAEASKPGAEPYQTQINRALRAFAFDKDTAEERLARDPQFIDRVAERVARYVAGGEGRVGKKRARKKSA